MPKPRRSNQRRRKEYFERKYTHKTLPLRVKLQLDRMTSALDWQLTILDELEKQVFTALKAGVGIITETRYPRVEQWDFLADPPLGFVALRVLNNVQGAVCYEVELKVGAGGSGFPVKV